MRRERGSALVVVVFALFLAIVIGAAALADTLGALRTSDHQQNVKRAQQAADAAIDAAIYGLNRLGLVDSLDIDPLDPATVTDQNCVVGTSGGSALDLVPLPALSSWCPESTGDMGGGVTWSYRVSQVTRVGGATCGDGSPLSLDRRIVAVGVSRGVERRVAATLRAPVSLFSGAAVQSGATGAPLRMGGTARVTGSAHSNGSIAGTGGAPTITGNAVHGAGGSVSGVTVAGVSGLGCHRFSLPAVDQGSAPSDNDNAALDADDGQAGDCVDHAVGLLPVLCDPPLLPPTGGFDFDADLRTLHVWGNGVFRLPGDTYSFCSIRLEGQAILLVPPGPHATRVFLDAPESCDSSIAGRGQITSDGLSRIVNCHAQTQPETLQLYAVGSASSATVQTLAGGGVLPGAALSALCGVSLPLVGTPMMVYAPRSQALLGGSSAIAGQVAANVVEMSGGASVTSVSSLVNLNELGSKPVLPLYRPQGYVSCTSKTFAELPADDPALGC